MTQPTNSDTLEFENILNKYKFDYMNGTARGHSGLTLQEALTALTEREETIKEEAYQKAKQELRDKFHIDADKQYRVFASETAIVATVEEPGVAVLQNIIPNSELTKQPQGKRFGMSKLHNNIKATIVRATVDHDTDTLEEALDEYVDAILDCIIKALPESKGIYEFKNEWTERELQQVKGYNSALTEFKQLLTDSKDK